MDDETQHRLAEMVYKTAILRLKGRPRTFVAQKAPKKSAK